MGEGRFCKVTEVEPVVCLGATGAISATLVRREGYCHVPPGSPINPKTGTPLLHVVYFGLG